MTPAPVDGGMDAGRDASMVCATSIECDDGLYCTGAETCAPFIAAADARGCVAAVSPPCAGGTCREDTDTCCFDVDGDGVSTCDDDCDDDDAARFPGNVEKCDYPLNVDEDCDPTTFGTLDGDGDGVAADRCCNGAVCGLDCDDTRAGTHLGVPEVCNGRDDDCNGLVDDDGVQVSGYADLDRDLYGDMAAPIMACAGSGGISSNMTDCNDAPAGGGSASPAFEEVAADGVDNDCDGMTDEGDASLALWYVDADADGFGTGAAVASGTPLPGHSLLAGDCDDSRGTRSPIAPELCNGVDDDCNGLADFPIGVNDWEDDDGDGVVDAACGGTAADCDDSDRSTYPGGPELCDGRDNDCDSMIDEMCGMAPMDGGVPDAGVDAAPAVDLGTCATGWVVCGGAVTCRATDPANCGGCGSACGGGYECVDSGCVPLGPCTGMPAGTTCRAATDICDVAEACVAGSGACPADGYASAGTTCRASTGSCDVAETCTGSAVACPAEIPSTELCNGVDDDCDGTVDNGFACAATASTGCLTACGVPGTRMCSASCAWGSCTSTVEICGNGCDDNGNATIDEGCDIVELSAGGGHTCARRSSGAVVCWGWNVHGEMGDGTTSVQAGPTSVSGLSDAVEISAGTAHTCARRTSGAVVCWGYNASGQLGDGTTFDRPTFITVPGFADAVEISVNGAVSCARRSSGSVLCWGDNAYGELGNGTTSFSPTPTPVPVSFLTDAVELSVGEYHACARRSSGAVVCWGNNADGQLGDGTTTQRTTPTTVSGLTDAVEISAAYYHTCARRSSGATVCWGRNIEGEIGDGTTTNRLTPTPVSGLPDAVELSANGGYAIAGGDFGCARQSSDAVVCWGWNIYGGLGDGTTTQRTTPTPVTGLIDAVEISAGLGHVCARRTGGAVVCWGWNLYGQLGDGTTTNQLTPTAVVGL